VIQFEMIQNRLKITVNVGYLSISNVRFTSVNRLIHTKKIELMLTRRAKAYSSSGLVV